MSTKLIAKNKIALFDYDIEYTLICWIKLTWYEVKSLKTQSVSLQEAYIVLHNNRTQIINFSIPLYAKTNLWHIWSYDPDKTRDILITKREIIKLYTAIHKTWLKAIPLEIYFNERNLIKIKVWVWKLRKKYDKKQLLKERDINKQLRYHLL